MLAVHTENCKMNRYSQYTIMHYVMVMLYSPLYQSSVKIFLPKLCIIAVKIASHKCIELMFYYLIKATDTCSEYCIIQWSLT